MKRYTLGNATFDERRQAARFLRGTGIEIGGAYLPIPVDSRCATVQYVDKLTASDLRALFPDVKDYAIVETDILCDVVTNGLSPFADASQDFVIASHLLEHLPNPLGFLKDCDRVLRSDGILYLVVPEKNFTFDRDRAVTPLAHLVDDMTRDARDVDDVHMADWLRHIRGTSMPDDPAEKQRVFRWELDRSIHVHVWTWEGMVEFLRHLIVNEQLAWELCEFYLPKKRQDEVIFVLRKTSGYPHDMAARFDATIETLLARENAMKAVIQSVDEQAAKADASRRLIPWLPPLGIQRTLDRIKQRLAARRAGAGNGEPPRERGAYKATWTALSTTVDQAKMHVAGYVEEEKFLASAEDTKKVLLDTVGIGADDVVLEIGCGVGRVGQVLAPLCKQWIGCDVSPNMLKHAAERLRAHRNVRFVELSGYDLAPIPDQSVDVVYCTVVFMHLDEWDRYRYVLEARRILRPGGRIYIDNFNLCGEEGWAVFDRHRAIQPDQRPAHISVSSTPQEIEMFLKKAGFQSVTVESHPLWARGWGKK